MDMTPVRLNEKLLGLILFLQRARAYYISKAEVFDFAGNWYRFVSEEYSQIPDELFDQAQIAHNNHNFDTALHFQVTPEMMNCQMDKLGQFTTGFWR